MRPRINPACINPKAQVFSQEVYTIKGRPDVKFFKRKDAIGKTIVVALRQSRSFTIMLNESPFCRIESNGTYNYIYNPSTDQITSPELKRFFIKMGFVMDSYRAAA